jgi:c-di-GMP-binding flagellar brake protein YcgR
VDKTLPDDRRRYFRISDNLGLAYRVITDDHITAAGEVRSAPVNIFELLVEHDEAIAQLLEQLRPRDPVVAGLAVSLNKKINCIVNQLEMESRMIEQIAHKICEVNISACGMGFRVDEVINRGERVQLDMVLLPENRRLLAQAMVIACEPLAEGHYVRMDFIDMIERDQEFLIQHIVKRQGDLLREAREQAEQTLRDAD